MKNAVLFSLGLAVAAACAAPTRADDPQPAADAKAVVTAPADDHTCLKETGSRIVRKDAQGRVQCNGEPGRSYGKDDLDRTGAINAGDALNMLDPAVSIHR